MRRREFGGVLRRIWRFLVAQSSSSLTRRIVVINLAGLLAFCMGLYSAAAGFFLLRMLVLLFPFDRQRANGAIWVGAAALIGLAAYQLLHPAWA